MFLNPVQGFRFLGGEVIEMRIAVFKHDSGLEYRDATPEEITEFERQQAAMPEPTPAEQREMTYNTDPIIPWGGAMLTVTEAAQQWSYYAAEGDAAKTDALTALISNAKRIIREQYKDETT